MRKKADVLDVLDVWIMTMEKTKRRTILKEIQIKGKLLERFRDTAREICHMEYPDLERRVEAMTIVNLTYDKLMSEIYPQGYNPYQE